VNKSAIVIPFLLASCASMPKAPETVYVEVYKECVGEVPQAPSQAIPINDSVSEQVRALLIDNARLKSYVAELEAVVSGCL
jgi:hypothetical protein